MFLDPMFLVSHDDNAARGVGLIYMLLADDELQGDSETSLITQLR